jgi:hypothetical protein
MFLTHIKIANQQARAPSLDATACDHSGRLSTDGDAIRCCQCLSQLMMMPNGEGAFRLEWVGCVAPVQGAARWAA